MFKADRTITAYASKLWNNHPKTLSLRLLTIIHDYLSIPLLYAVLADRSFVFIHTFLLFLMTASLFYFRILSTHVLGCRYLIRYFGIDFLKKDKPL